MGEFWVDDGANVFLCGQKVDAVGYGNITVANAVCDSALQGRRGKQEESQQSLNNQMLLLDYNNDTVTSMALQLYNKRQCKATNVKP